MTPPAEHELEIRSFGVVFDLERRIHKVDRFRIPLPYGLPLRSIAYAVGTLATILLLARVPGSAQLLGVLPAPARLVLVPCAASWVLTQTRIDGRPAHSALTTIARFLVSPRRVAAARAAPLGAVRLADLTIVADERSARYRRARIHGPAVVLLRGAFGFHEHGRELVVHPGGDRALMSGTRVRLQAGQRLVVR